MATFAEIQRDLDWGLHDAGLDALEIDYAAAELGIVLRVKLGRRQERERRARVVVTGLVYVVVEPPCLEANGDMVDGDMRIDLVTEGLMEGEKLARPPEGCFGQSFFVADWNAFFHVVGTDVRFKWIETEPTETADDAHVLLPGEEFDVPAER